MLLRSWRTAVTCDTDPSAHAYGADAAFHVVPAQCGLTAAGRHAEKLVSGHVGTISITVRACRPSRNANETSDPVRPDAVNPRFHGVRQQADRHDQLKLTVTTVLMVLM
jgi:hypothetical protein